MGLAPRSI
uniref:Uncharacterized protein n=1 Tax=Anguilla anguilla TaxID=7936 RepID=A0A0E9QJW1_ANGAN